MEQKNILPSEFYDEREIDGKKVKVIIRQMTKEEARKVFPYRPYSKYSESRFGGNSLCDDISLLVGGDATRCKMCKAPTLNKYIIGCVCPDCDGRSERSYEIDPCKK